MMCTVHLFLLPHNIVNHDHQCVLCDKHGRPLATTVHLLDLLLRILYPSLDSFATSFDNAYLTLLDEEH
jgi:hypothetical protein